ncbi:MAG: hypothetical protein ACJASF_001488 [Vicingaceae bacterium]|jgi:hypothetical protein
MHKIATILLFFSFYLNAYTQEKVTIQLQVLDCQSKEKLPFANVVSVKYQTGTACNFEGNFSFITTPDNTLHVTYIGYKKKTIPVSEYKTITKVCLSPKSINIEAITVNAESNFLYRLVADCRKNRLTEMKSAKSYFLLKSMINNKQVELVEAYYNGTYQDHDVKDLELKTGKIYLSKFENNSYISMGTSSGINLHKTLDFNLYFPGSPLEWNEQKLQKKFKLSFHEKFIQDQKTVYVIDFQEREKEGKFYGRLWVDSANQVLIKVRLQNDFGANSPFVAVSNAEKISKISFDITKNFELKSGVNTIKSIDFNYQLNYTRTNKQQVKVETKAVLFAYNYNEQFILPFFSKTYRLNDYQGINLAPYNFSFWKKNTEFKLMAKESEKRLFIESNTTNLIDSFSYNPITREISFSEPTYRKWSTSRMRLNDIKDKSSARKYMNVYLKYNLDVKIFMDINQTEDSNEVQLVTILDPFTSYSNLDESPNSIAFVNMYFDLVEIKKRELESKINTRLSVKAIKLLYEKMNAELVDISREFFTETAGGTNRTGMSEWNEYV